MKSLLIGLLGLVSVSAFAKCEITRSAPFTYVCGAVNGKIITNITMEKYPVKAKRKFAATVCKAFRKGKLKSFEGHVIYASGEPIGADLYDDQGLILESGCGSPWEPLGLPENFLGACNVKVLDSVECE